MSNQCKTVPVDPTHLMIGAGARAVLAAWEKNKNLNSLDTVKIAYAAMLAASPAIDAAGANEPNWAFEAAKINLDRIHAVCMEFGCRPQETVVDWLRERLTVGNPVVWAVYCGLGEMRPISVHFKKEEALKVASEIKSNTEVRPLYAAPAGRHAPSEAERNHQAFKDGLNANLDAAESRDRRRFECAARKQGTAGGNDAADCDYPGCGCDPSVDLETEIFMRKNYGWTKS